MNNLFGKTLEDIIIICDNLSLPKYTAKQITNWLYNKQIKEIKEMTNLSLKTREKLTKEYQIDISQPLTTFISKDGTKKYLFQYGEKEKVFVEAVVIFDRDRVTLCISSQAGCKLNCSFCATGKQGFKKNLLSGEILNIYRSIDEHKAITNIVYMGMGEPLDNWKEVKKSIQVLTSEWGYAISPRRITVSTCGILPKMENLLNTTQCNIAISLHSAIYEQRKQIMPVENSFPISEVVKFLRNYDWSGQRNLTFEYIVFDNFNNTPQHVDALVKLLKGLKCKINLIRYHSISKHSKFRTASEYTMIAFRDNLIKKGLFTTIRASKGEDILAACGLLSEKNYNYLT
ncbi:MAG: 23S rRNA (adenine(2503)-C(2))-methyltransferase RlmN [Bacteroidales bacterium]|jgi:23S rRNA (adenine2503-C2)-methyltransferase|nr:23S rRNA (adenine(2503)-C(2))-methyltransferase RlmN [Bacteroidales bacterium]